MDIQSLVNAMNESGRLTRGRYQMTLGKMIDALTKFDQSALVVFGGADDGAPGSEDSYRGYYSDLSFDASGKNVTVSDFKKSCEAALGQTYQGYKGGDYKMGADTPLWCASYGCCGNAIMNVSENDGKIVLVTRDVERD